MQPVLKESSVRKHSALYEKESARTSVRSADLRDSLGPKVYMSDGSAPKGIM